MSESKEQAGILRSLLSLPHSKVVRLFRERLSARLTALFVLVALIPMTVVTLLSYRLARDSLVDLALSKVEQEATLTVRDTQTYLEQFSTDLLALSESPPVQGIIRARDNNGFDPVANETYSSWSDQLKRIFVTLAQGKDFYQSIRYLNESGDEIVRVDYRDNKVTVVSDDDRLGLGARLENRAETVYFITARSLRRGQVYVSPISLKRDGGDVDEIERPLTPIIQFSTPIYDSAKNFRGVMVSSVYATSFLDRLGVENGQIYLATQVGYYLVHPDPARTFGFELDIDDNVASDFGSTYRAFLDSGSAAYTTLDPQRGEVIAMQKLPFAPYQPERHWLLIRTLPERTVIGPVQRFGALVAGLAVIVTALTALPVLRLGRGLTQPMARLTRVAEQISQEDLPQLVNAMGQVAAGESVEDLDLHAQPVAVRSEDEIGQLGEAFNRMIANLRTAHPRLLEAQRSLHLALQETEGLLAAAQAVLGATRSTEICETLISHLNGLVQADQMALFLVDHERREILLTAGHGNVGDELSLEYEDLLKGISGMVFESGKPIISLHADDGIEPEATRERRRQVTPGPLIVVPLMTKGKVIGTITASNEPGQRPFNQHDTDLLTSMAAQAAVAIENAWLYEEAQREIADRKEIEKALRRRTVEMKARNEELDAFAHTVAHDLKNPLSLMVGWAETLEETHLNVPADEMSRYLHLIAMNGRRMSTIIDELLLLSSLRKMEVAEEQPLDMASILAWTRERLAAMIEEYQAEIILPESWPVALGYPPWIEEVWVNYLSNALKYGGRPPRVELGATRRPDGMIRFWIRDNGRGIPTDAQARLFTPFTRLDQSHLGGHGLGLSIVHRIVKKLGGRVGVESRPGEGSTFWFELPAPTAESS